MPDKQPGLHRQVSYAQRKSDNIGEERHAGVRKEEFAPHREQLWMQNFLYSRQIDFRILGKGMVSLHQQGAHGQREQPKEIQRLVLVGSHSMGAIATCGGIAANLRFRSATQDAMAKAASTTYCGSIGRR